MVKFFDQFTNNSSDDENSSDNDTSSSNSGNDDFTSFVHSEAADPYSKNTNKVIEHGRSLPLQALIKELLLQGVAEKDLHREKDTDSPEIIRLKRKLISSISYSKKSKRYHRENDKDSYENKSKANIRETIATIKRFMDFDHNRDRDGRQSLGEHKGNRSTFEKKLITAAAASTLNKINVSEMTHDFSNAIEEKISHTKNELMEEMKDHLMEKAMKTAIPSSIKTYAEIGKAIAHAVESEGVQPSEPQISSNITQGERATQHQASVQFMGEGTTTDIEHPDKTPNQHEFQQKIAQSRGFEGHSL